MSNIQWTDETWNPTVGCSRISQGCANCYAAEAAKSARLRKSHKCCECGFAIPVGDRYQRIGGIWEGEAKSFATCLNCVEVRSRIEEENDSCCLEIGRLADFIIESDYLEEEPVRHGLSCAIGVTASWMRRANGRFEIAREEK